VKPLLSAQYLRALASIGVVAFHTGRATILGQAGVDVFFVISGFIMWMVTIKPIGPGAFLWHRVARVVPLYWIATLIMVALHKPSAADAIESLLFWPHRDAGGQIWPVLVQGWTLNFEMFFYLVFAGILLIPRRLQLLSLTLVLCSLSALGLALRPHGAALHTYTSPLFLEFLAGVWLSEIVRRNKFPGFKLAVGMLVVGLLGFAISLRNPAPDLWRFVVWGGPSLLVVCGAISIELRHGLPTIGPLKLLGDGSYSIYLFHTFIFYAVFYVAKSPVGQWTAPIPVVAVSVTVAGTSIGIAAFYLFERPLTALLKRLTKRVIVARASPGSRLHHSPTAS
jgi:exopolysaccharide production protein ExoZ